MFTPERLVLQNYCQHTALDIDFSEPLHIIIGENGRGKSNILNALVFALTGAATPGARALDDDILDGADNAIVSLTFSTKSGQRGTITRKLKRKSGSHCFLELDGQEIEGSEKCQERLQELLGNDLKSIMNTVVVGQHDISSLLLAGQPSKRIANLQTLLLGDTFTNALDAVAQEKAKLYIDENVQEAMRADKKTLNEQKKLQKMYTSQVGQLAKTLDSKKLQTLKDKAAKISEYRELVAKWVALHVEEGELNRALTALQDELKNLGEVPDIKALEVAFHNLKELQLLWDNYNKYNQQKVDIAQQINKLTSDQALLVEHEKQYEQNVQLEAKVTAAREYYKLLSTITDATTKLAALTQNNENLGKELQTSKDKTKEVEANILKYSGKLGVLKEFLGKEHASDICPICENSISQDRRSILSNEYTAFLTLSTELQNQLQELTKHINEVTNKIVITQAEILGINTLITESSVKLTTLEKPAYTEEELAKLSLPTMVSKKVDLANITGQLHSLQSQLTQLSNGDIPKPSSDFNADVFKTVTEQLESAKAIEKQLATKNVQISEVKGKITLLSSRKLQLEEIAKEKALPKLSVGAGFNLSEEEEAYLKGALEKEVALKEAESQLIAVNTYIKNLEERISNTESAVEGVVATKDYASYLTKIAKVLKVLPNTILQHQLADLCKSMQEIIATFHFYQPFGVMVNDKLEFQLRYPNKAVRPIKKASGGEQIILGIAFRLAAHRKFSTLDWLAIDEPTNHLTNDNIKILQQVISHLKSNLNLYGIKKLIIATHSPLLVNSEAHIINL